MADIQQQEQATLESSKMTTLVKTKGDLDKHFDQQPVILTASHDDFAPRVRKGRGKNPGRRTYGQALGIKTTEKTQTAFRGDIAFMRMEQKKNSADIQYTRFGGSKRGKIRGTVPVTTSLNDAEIGAPLIVLGTVSTKGSVAPGEHSSKFVINAGGMTQTRNTGKKAIKAFSNVYIDANPLHKERLSGTGHVSYFSNVGYPEEKLVPQTKQLDELSWEKYFNINTDDPDNVKIEANNKGLQSVPYCKGYIDEFLVVVNNPGLEEQFARAFVGMFWAGFKSGRHASEAVIGRAMNDSEPGAPLTVKLF